MKRTRTPDQAETGRRKIVADRLGKLKKQLIDNGWYSSHALESTSTGEWWRAFRLEGSDAIPDARYRFKYTSIEPNCNVSHDALLDYLDPAIWAYCAGQEFLREGAPDLFDAFMAHLGVWMDRQQSVALHHKQAASKNSRRQERKVDPDAVAKLLAEGRSQRWIADKFGVKPQTISKIKRTKLDKNKKQPS